jgi:hypothetical protein
LPADMAIGLRPAPHSTATSSLHHFLFGMPATQASTPALDFLIRPLLMSI